MRARTATSQSSLSFEDVLSGRFSCRSYLPEEVPEAVIREIVEMSIQTASWTNTQPWKVLITRGEGTTHFRDALYTYATEHQGYDTDIPYPIVYGDEAMKRRRECGHLLYSKLGIDRENKEARKLQSMENFRLFGAPHAAIFTSDRSMGMYGAVDVGSFISNFMLAAYARGIGTVAQASLTQFAPFVREYFDIPEDRMLVYGVSFGYPDHSHPINQYRTKREKTEDVMNIVG